MGQGLNDDGTIKPDWAYPTSYANSLRAEWGQMPMNTSDYSWGTDQIYDKDCFGTAIQEGNCPW